RSAVGPIDGRAAAPRGRGTRTRRTPEPAGPCEPRAGPIPGAFGKYDVRPPQTRPAPATSEAQRLLVVFLRATRRRVAVLRAGLLRAAATRFRAGVFFAVLRRTALRAVVLRAVDLRRVVVL